MPEVSFMDVDNGYDWVGGDKVALTEEWQHIAMEAVPTLPKHNMHEIQIAFMVRSLVLHSALSAPCWPSHPVQRAPLLLRSREIARRPGRAV
jgi:hypothetical protein